MILQVGSHQRQVAFLIEFSKMVSLSDIGTTQIYNNYRMLSTNIKSYWMIVVIIRTGLCHPITPKSENSLCWRLYLHISQ